MLAITPPAQSAPREISATWREEELAPFRQLTAEDMADLVMVGHLFNSRIDPLLPAGDPGLAERLRPILLKHGGHQHEHMIEPIGYFFVPVFFVLTGMQVDLKTLADPTILGVGIGVTAAAIAGKLVAGFAAGSSGKWLAEACGPEAACRDTSPGESARRSR